MKRRQIPDGLFRHARKVLQAYNQLGLVNAGKAREFGSDDVNTCYFVLDASCPGGMTRRPARS